MKRFVAVACCFAALAASAQPVCADSGSSQKVCIITGVAKEQWLFIPVPKWADASLCEAMLSALPAREGRDTKLGCMVGPNDPDFTANTFHIFGTNSGNPCHWP